MTGIAALLAACDSINENDRLIYVKPAEVGRAVLLEDFTGQKCVNCPAAAEEIHNLQKQYGEDKVIAVGIHSGPLAVFPTATVVGLRTTIGDEYYAHWNVESEPAGVIDRKTKPLTKDQWAGQVYTDIQQKSSLTLAISNVYDEASKTVTINTKALSSEGVSGKYQLWLVEDSITAIQLMADGSANKSYVHMHVFRAPVNGNWGEDIILSEGVEKTLKHTFTLNATWVPKHVSVVAFVYNDQGVVQVVKSPVIAQTNTQSIKRK